MKKAFFIAVLFAGLVAQSPGAVVWDARFDQIGDWVVGDDPKGGSTNTTDGTSGLLYVNGNNTTAAFIPDVNLKAFIAYDAATINNYVLHLQVSNVTLSCSYDISMDMFDADHNHIGTVWDIVPQTAITGSNTYSMAKIYMANTAYLMPKITVHTGNGAQTVTIFSMTVDETDAVPEPVAGGLLLIGFGGVMYVRRHLERKRRVLQSEPTREE